MTSETVMDEVRLPSDQAAREQIRGDLGHTLNVVAGAGTGKTHELVERVVGLLRDVPMSDIGVITFTTAAASELQERIRERVEERALAEAGDGPYSRALQALDDAAISTLHAFAQRILSEHPLEASLPPGFEVLDPIQESVAFEDWWQRTLDQLFADEGLAPSLLVLGALGVKPSRYRQLARILTEHHDRTAAYGIALAPVPQLNLVPLLDAIDAATDLRTSCTDPSDRLLVHLDELQELGDRLRVLQHDELEALALLGERAKLTCTYGKQGSWRDDGKELAAKACSVANDARLAALAAVVDSPRSRTCWRRSCARSRPRRGGGRHEGRVTFHDLLVLARNLLRDDGRRPRRARGPLPGPAARRVPGHRPAPDRPRDAHRRHRLRGRRRGRLERHLGPAGRAVRGRRPEAVHLPVPPGRHRAVRPGRGDPHRVGARAHRRASGPAPGSSTGSTRRWAR